MCVIMGVVVTVLQLLSYHIQASHAQDIGAAAIGVMPTTFFKPSSIGNETL